jgi:hypothetical protein
MLKDINRITLFIRSSEGKESRSKLFINAIIITFLILFNRFYLINFVNDDYKIAYTQSKILFKDGLSPYETKSMDYISQIADEEGWNYSQEFKTLGNPIFQYFIFMPFTILRNYDISQTFFITFNQLCVIISAKMVLSLLNIKLKRQEELFLLVFSPLFYFVLFPLMSSNVSAILLAICVGIFFFLERKKYILSGILLGCIILDPIGIFYILILFSILLINQHKELVLIWAFITISLLTLMSFIFDKNWVLGWLKYLFLSPSRYPFLSFIYAAENKFNVQLNRLFSIIPILLGLWLMVEIIRSQKDDIVKILWLFSITGIANHYMMVQSHLGVEIFYFPALILVISFWWKKIKRTGNIIPFSFIGIISFGFVVWRYSLADNFIFNYERFLAFCALILLVNLYWIRPWIMKQYDIKSNHTKYL